MDKSISLQQIGTPRLTIRPLTEEDIPNIFSLMSDFETASRAGFRPMASSSEAEGYLRESIRSGYTCGLTLKERPWDVFGIMTLFPSIVAFCYDNVKDLSSSVVFIKRILIIITICQTRNPM